MTNRIFGTAILVLGVSTFGGAQASKDARFKILGTVIAEQASAKIPMPFGADGFEISDAGVVDEQKVTQAIKKNGQSIEPGRVVTITAIEFADNKIEIELDGGGKNKKSILGRIEVGMGGKTTPVDRGDTNKAKGSKIVLKFANKVPADISPSLLHELLMPALDFQRGNFVKTGIDSLPPEYQEAVKAKEVRIGMDRDTVIMAMGRADKHFRDKDEKGAEQVTWIYLGRGKKATFVWFQNEVVVKIAAY